MYILCDLHEQKKNRDENARDPHRIQNNLEGKDRTQTGITTINLYLTYYDVLCKGHLKL